MNLKKQIYSAIMLTVALTVLLGVVYPVVVTAISQALFKERAEGSLIKKDGQVIGSHLIGQPFSSSSR